MAKNLYRADRDFNHFVKGEVYELPDDDPYVATGYLEPYVPVEAPAVEPTPAFANDTRAPEVETGSEEADSGNAEGGAARPRSAARAGGRK
jgi:hypothetical protein